jgi:hypothetical protein
MTNQGFTKDFLSQITNLKNSYLLSFVTVGLLSRDNAVDLLKNDYFRTEGFTFYFSDIANLIQDSKNTGNTDFEILIREYLMFSTRSLFLYMYEGFKNDTNRYDLVKDTEWFIFLANIRHSLAHGVDAIWSIKNYGKEEICYSRNYDGMKISIDQTWNNTPMEFKQIGGWDTCLDLINTIEIEATNRLKD